MPTRLAAVLSLLALALAGCGEGDITGCMVRCQTYLGEQATCQTMCTRSCPELRESFGINEETCRQMQEGSAKAPETKADEPGKATGTAAGPAAATGAAATGAAAAPEAAPAPGSAPTP